MKCNGVGCQWQNGLSVLVQGCAKKKQKKNKERKGKKHTQYVFLLTRKTVSLQTGLAASPGVPVTSSHNYTLACQMHDTYSLPARRQRYTEWNRHTPCLQRHSTRIKTCSCAGMQAGSSTSLLHRTWHWKGNITLSWQCKTHTGSHLHVTSNTLRDHSRNTLPGLFRGTSSSEKKQRDE